MNRLRVLILILFAILTLLIITKVATIRVDIWSPANSFKLTQYQITETELRKNLGNKEWLLHKVLHFGTVIGTLNLEQLSPGPVANALFGGLVNLVKEFPPAEIVQDILTDPRIETMREGLLEQCSMAEFLMEVRWATEIASGEEMMEDFIYYQNYKSLIEFELKCLHEYAEEELNISTIGIIGSGPLPLSSIQLAMQLPKSHIINYDYNPEALALGEAAVELRQNLTNRISSILRGGNEIRVDDGIGSVNVVYLAALVGEGKEKEQIISPLYDVMKKGAILASRRATGLRTLLYREVEEKDFGKFRKFREYHPSNKFIINSIALGTK